MFSHQRPLRPFIFLTIVLLLTALGIMVATTNAGQDSKLYLPFVTKTANCNVPGQSYASLPIIPPPIDKPAADHPELNLGLRGYEATTAALNVVQLGPVHDANAPQLDALFAPDRLPTFSNTYHRYKWDYGCDCVTDDTSSPWDTTVLGIAVTPGEVIRVPDSGYDVGGGNDVLVLYAESTRLTLHYAREDDVNGYVIHLEDVCVEPDLLALYQQLDAAGRNQLPALPGRKPLGRALGSEIKVAVRDGGHFLDPRSCNDWWQDYSC